MCDIWKRSKAPLAIEDGVKTTFVQNAFPKWLPFWPSCKHFRPAVACSEMTHWENLANQKQVVCGRKRWLYTLSFGWVVMGIIKKKSKIKSWKNCNKSLLLQVGEGELKRFCCVPYGHSFLYSPLGIHYVYSSGEEERRGEEWGVSEGWAWWLASFVSPRPAELSCPPTNASC